MSAASPAELRPSLDRDVACLNCGYNLRGMTHEGTCPECGMAVRVSLREDALAAAPADHLRRLRRGATLFTAGAALSLPLLFFGLIPATVGAWLVTAPQPGREEPLKDRRLRFVTRTLLVLGALVLVALAAAGVAMFALNGRAVFRLRDEWQSLDTALIAGCALFWMGIVALSAYLDGLAERAPATRLGPAVRSFRRQWLTGLAVIVAVGGAAQVAEWVYQSQNVYLRWTAPAFAVVVAATLFWLWLAALTLGVQLRRRMPRPTNS